MDSVESTKQTIQAVNGKEGMVTGRRTMSVATRASTRDGCVRRRRRDAATAAMRRTRRLAAMGDLQKRRVTLTAARDAVAVGISVSLGAMSFFVGPAVWQDRFRCGWMFG